MDWYVGGSGDTRDAPMHRRNDFSPPGCWRLECQFETQANSFIFIRSM